MAKIDGPYADVRDMYAVHTVLRRELRISPTLVRRVVTGDLERARIVGDHVALMVGALHVHHSSEDTHIWPRLLDRAPEELAPVIHIMEEQHKAIDAEYDAVSRALSAWRASAAAGPRETLAEVLDRLNGELVEHLGLEEEEVVPAIARHITAAEWDAMVQEGGADMSPAQAPLLFGMMMYEGDPAAVQKAVDNMPPELRPVIKDMAAQAYAAYCERLHGGPVPPQSVA